MKILLLLLTLILTSCSSTYTAHREISLHIDKEEKIKEMCHNNLGCAYPNLDPCIIWITDDDDVLLHEINHCLQKK